VQKLCEKPRALVIAVALLAATTGVAQDATTPTATEKAVINTVWTGLNAQRSLVDHHRGFLAYISAHPQLESALEAVRPLERDPWIVPVQGGLQTKPGAVRQSARCAERVAENAHAAAFKG